MTADPDAALAAVVREEWGRLTSLLLAQFRRLDLVEDALGDAVESAARRWPRDGVPDNPPAWLHTAARRRVVDRLRAEAMAQRKVPLLVVEQSGREEAAVRVDTGDLVEDLTHNYFLETGARNGKLKVYEAVDHPAARALTGYLIVRGGVHQVAYARALELLTGADLTKAFPMPRIPTDKIPECKPHIKRGEHLKLYRFSPEDFQELAAVFNGPHPETGEDLQVADEAQPEGAPAHDLPPQTAVFAPGPAPEEIAEIAAKLRQAADLPKEPTGTVANNGKAKSNGSTKARSRAKASAR